MNSDSRPARLLVVDDDPVVVLLLCHQLVDAGYLAVAAESAAQAWERLDEGSFDLLLLDVGLPDQDGFGLCRDIKSRPQFQDLPVVFITARGSEYEVLRGFDAGGVDYVVKPFDLRVLLARVATHTTLARLSRNLQAALNARTESLRLAHRRMRELDSQMALTEERERRRLADQLHDTTIQQLVLARILTDSLPGTPVPKELVRIKDLLDSSLAQLRSLVFELSPPVLYQGGLFPALEWLAGQLESRWSLRYRCIQSGVPVDLPLALRVTLFQGARELMTNAARHARALVCEVRLDFAARTLGLMVCDDGIGIPASFTQANPAVAGFGLFSLRSRIELLGGVLEFAIPPRGGTQARLRVPLDGLSGSWGNAARTHA